MSSPRTVMPIYRVTIQYREPTYELATGRKRDPYWWTYRMAARSEADAVHQAIVEFRGVERNSSVGWTREIIGTVVEPA